VNIHLIVEQHSKTIVYGLTKSRRASNILVLLFCYNCYFWLFSIFVFVFLLLRSQGAAESKVVVGLLCVFLIVILLT
jgi:hypothetical protein